MCFFGKRKYIASIACLKRALYLDPFEWIIAYNLGLVHLTTGQCASAFHFFSASINLKADFPASYTYLAVTLAKLDDFENACAAYDRALEVDGASGGGGDFTIRLNYAITAFSGGDTERSRTQFGEFERLWLVADEESKSADPDVETQAEALGRALGM